MNTRDLEIKNLENQIAALMAQNRKDGFLLDFIVEYLELCGMPEDPRRLMEVVANLYDKYH